MWQGEMRVLVVNVTSADISFHGRINIQQFDSCVWFRFFLVATMSEFISSIIYQVVGFGLRTRTAFVYSSAGVFGRFDLEEDVVESANVLNLSQTDTWYIEWPTQAHRRLKFVIFTFCNGCVHVCQLRFVSHARASGYYHYFAGKWNHPTDTIQFNKTKRLRDATNRIVGELTDTLRGDRSELETDASLTVAVLYVLEVETGARSFSFYFS